MTKPKATHIPAFIDPPPPPMPEIDDPALLGEWIAFRDDMDELEASLSIDHPELDWTDAMRPFKTRPTGRSGRSRPPTNFHAGKIEP